MDREKFSVVMNAYGGDHPEWFEIAVNSVISQTAAPDEVVLVVDGPVPEALAAAISRYEHRPEFQIIRLEKNQGLGNARRVALEHCTYDLVVLMDSDDISVPDRFEKQLKAFAENPQTDVVGGIIDEFIGEPTQVVGVRKVPRTDAEIKAYLKTRCPLNHVTVMFRKSAVAEAGGYEDWYYNEDYYLWIRMYLAGKFFYNLQDVLVHVRVGEDMYRRRGGMRYFKSEAKLQKYMLDHHIIGFGTYTLNVIKRLIVQVLLPNSLRGWVFQMFARSKD